MHPEPNQMTLQMKIDCEFADYLEIDNFQLITILLISHSSWQNMQINAHLEANNFQFFISFTFVGFLCEFASLEHWLS